MDALKAALDTFPGGQKALAKAIGTTPQFVWQWAKGRRPIPPRFAIAIEDATKGAVTRYQISPQVFGTKPAEPARKSRKREA